MAARAFGDGQSAGRQSKHGLDRKGRPVNDAAKPPGWVREILPFVVICLGGFMALLDIQIVASSLQDIGGGLCSALGHSNLADNAYLVRAVLFIPPSRLVDPGF